MEVIRFQKTAGSVSFRFSITGLVVWRYQYDADGAVFRRKSPEGTPPPHALGTPEELESDANAWDVHLLSPDDENREYAIEVAWTQGSTVIHQWKRNGKVGGSTPVTESGSAFLLAAP